jgi:hypothetical protein
MSEQKLDMVCHSTDLSGTHDSLPHVPSPELNSLTLVIAIKTDLPPLLRTSDKGNRAESKGVYVLEEEVGGSSESQSERDGEGGSRSVLEDIDQGRGGGGRVVRHGEWSDVV